MVDDPGARTDKDRALDALRQAYPEEIDVRGEKLRADARRAGHSPEEIEDAINTHPHRDPKT